MFRWRTVIGEPERRATGEMHQAGIGWQSTLSSDGIEGIQERVALSAQGDP